MPTRRTVLSATGVAIGASLTPPAVAASGPSLRMDLSGDYGSRLEKAQRRAFHLHNEHATSALHRALTQLWTSVYEKTSGALLVTVLPLNANLPLDDAEAVFDIAAGRFELVSVAAPIVDTLIPDLALQSLPFTYRSVDEVLALSGQPAFARMLEPTLARAGLTYVSGGTFSNGFRIVASSAKAVRTLGDLKGVKIRVPPSAVIKLIFSTLGADPFVTTIADMRAAFVAGTINAEENPPGIVPAFCLQSVAHWLNVTNHMWTGFNTLANRDFWSSLPPKVRDVIEEVLPDIRAEQVARQEGANAAVLKQPGDGDVPGMEIVATDVSGAHQLMKPVYASMLSRFSPAARQLAEPLLDRDGR